MVFHLLTPESRTKVMGNEIFIPIKSLRRLDKTHFDVKS